MGDSGKTQAQLAELQSVAVPGLVVRILNGTGRINVGQGAVMTVQGVGASLSPAIGGWIAQWQGVRAGVSHSALGSLLIWTGFAAIIKPACTTGLPGGDPAVPALPHAP